MMKCYGCNADIDTDSRFCDQCGLENLVCVKCGITGGTKFCEKCGGKMEVAQGTIALPKNEPMPEKIKEKTTTVEPDSDATVRVQKKENKVILVHSPTGTKLSFSNDDDLGRRTGTHAAFLKQFSAISGSHGKIYIKGENFCYEDVGSTNGSRYNNISLDSGKAVVLEKGAILILADQEFSVQ